MAGERGRPSSHARGTAASLAASVLFGALFLLPPLLSPLTAEEIFAWRIVTTLPVLAILIALSRDASAIGADLRRIALSPRLTAVVVIDGLLLGVQIWLFGWAPQSGHGLDVALGYLLMPLVLVAVGAVYHRERLHPMRWLSVGLAVCGVGAAISFAGGLSWSTAIVALGYPLYFTIRRRAGLDGTGALAGELAVSVPLAVWILLAGVGAGAGLHVPVPAILALGIVSGCALMLYIVASRILPFATFGLLSYLEPVLLVAISALLLGERLTAADALVYGPIGIALILLAVPRPTRPRG